MSYLEQYNHDNIHARAIIVGLINLLNQEVFIINTHSNERQDIVEVPFYYSTTGDERFLQDYFMEWRDCVHPKYLDGSFDPVPRGVVALTDMSINSSNLTQRWIRGNFNRIVDGRIETYNAYLNSIPIDMNFDVTMKVDTITEAFKIVQAVLEVFYRNQVYNTTFKGLMIPCQVGFPEQYTLTKNFEFSYPSDTKIEVTFSLAVETYFPVIDEPNLGSTKAISNANPNDTVVNTTNQDLGSRMGNSGSTYFVGRSRREQVTVRSGSNTISINDNMSAAGASVRKASNRMNAVCITSMKPAGDPDETTIKLIYPKTGDEFYSNEYLNIKWDYEGFLHKVNLYYSLDYGNTWSPIEMLYQGSAESYKWLIPNFSELIKVIVITPDGKGKGADIYAMVDIDGGIYDTIIVNTGHNYNQTVSLDIESEEGHGVELIPSVIDGKIVDVLVRNPGENYRITKQVEVSLKIEGVGIDAEDHLKDNDGNVGVILVK